MKKFYLLIAGLSLFTSVIYAQNKTSVRHSGVDKLKDAKSSCSTARVVDNAPETLNKNLNIKTRTATPVQINKHKSTNRSKTFQQSYVNNSNVHVKYKKGDPGLIHTTGQLLHEDFEMGMPAGFTIIDGDGFTPFYAFMTNAWIVDSIDAVHKFCALSSSYYQTPGASDDWMITSAITIPSGAVANLTWDASAFDTDPMYQDGYEVLLSTTGVLVSDFTNNLTTVANENHAWTSHSIDLSAYAGQTVYIAFHNNFYDGNLLLVDNIDVSTVSPSDVGVIDVTAPKFSGCNLSNAETVTVKIKNFGTQSISNVPVSFILNSNAAVNETYSPTINSGDTATYTFTAKVDASAAGTYMLKAFTALSGDGSLINDTTTFYFDNAVSSDLTSPLTMGFETTDDLTGWTLSDADGDGVGWALATTYNHSGSYCIRKAGSAGNDNDWLFTKCLDLTAGVNYKLDYFYKNFDLAAIASLQALIGTKNDTTMTQVIVTNPVPTDTTYKYSSTTFSVPSSGIYYIAFRCFSTSGTGTSSERIDDINITLAPPTDVSVVDIPSPLSGCNLSNAETVTIKVKNNGSTAVNNIPVSYQLDANPPVSETLTATINPGDTATYSFSTKLDVSAQGSYTLYTYTSLSGDGNLVNDTMFTYVDNAVSSDLTSPLTMGFELSDDLSGWVFIDADKDGVSWSFSSTFTHSGTYCIRKPGSGHNDNDWLFTKCLDLTAGNTYRLDYFYKNFDLTAMADLQTFVGSSQDTTLTQIIATEPVPTDTTYKFSTNTFTVPSSGIYYVAFRCFSSTGTGTSSERIDDVTLTIDNGNSIKEKNISQAISVYPNPSNGRITLTNSGIDGEYQVKIMNAMGQLVQNTNFSGKYVNHTLDLSSFPNGIYMMEVKTDKQMMNKKIIINK